MHSKFNFQNICEDNDTHRHISSPDTDKFSTGKQYSSVDIMLQSGWQGWVVSGSMNFYQKGYQEAFWPLKNEVKSVYPLHGTFVNDWNWLRRCLHFLWLLTCLSNKEWLFEVHMHVHFQSWTPKGLRSIVHFTQSVCSLFGKWPKVKDIWAPNPSDCNHSDTEEHMCLFISVSRMTHWPHALWAEFVFDPYTQLCTLTQPTTSSY